MHREEKVCAICKFWWRTILQDVDGWNFENGILGIDVFNEEESVTESFEYNLNNFDELLIAYNRVAQWCD